MQDCENILFSHLFCPGEDGEGVEGVNNNISIYLLIVPLNSFIFTETTHLKLLAFSYVSKCNKEACDWRILEKME